MAFHKLAGAFIHEVTEKHATKKDSVCDFGNQTMRVEVGSQFGVETTKEYYTKLGYKNYLAIDVNTEMDAVAMDLNYMLNDRYGFNETFSLVTNNGTGEHLFNQYSVFANAHNVCEVGGIMIHILPLYSFDHGFFNFNQNLFAALAYQNDYEIIESWISTTRMNYCEKDVEFTLKRQTTLDRELGITEWDKTYGPEIAVAMRKTDEREFEIPMQYLYSGDNITDTDISKNYRDINK